LPTGFPLADVNKAESQSFSALVSITATNNGPDDYGIVPSFTPTNAAGTATFGFFPNADGTGTEITSVELGATAMQEASTTNAIKVPHDGSSTADSVVNGLEVGDKVDIDSVTYTIGAVDETDPDFVLITLTGATLPGSPVGTAIQEIKDVFLFTSTVGTRTAPGDPADLAVVITATPTLNAGLAASIDTFTINIVRVTITKYVRNIFDSNCFEGGTTCTTPAPVTSPATFYESGAGTHIVKANSGQTLEYLIRVITPADVGSELVDAVIGDVLPPFTAYVASSTTLNTQAVTDGNGGGTGPEFPLDSAISGTDTVPGMLIQDGLATSSGDQGDGGVAISSTVDVVYQVILQ
ncbi:MAG: hypothetical protein ACJAWG_002765, partial [Candidatus Azotimanducaceae bacterium]